MSLNSLQDDMSRRAASMAAMARRANNPQEIQAIQKSLVAGVQNGSIQPYVGIPLIQDLTKKLAEATAKMAQTVAGAGMPQPPADGPPIAQQVMQQAAQESQGVEALPSNLPQSYAGGGIIAFEGGGEVERYQNKGLVSDDEQTKRNKEREAQARRDRAALLTLPAAAGDILAGPYNYLAQTGEAAANAIGVPRIGRALGIYDSDVNSVGIPRIGAGGNTPYSDMLNRYAAGDSTAPPPPPAAYPDTRRSAYTDAPIPNTPGATATAAAPSAAPGGAIPGAGNFQMPTLAGMTMAPVPGLTDYKALIGDMPAKTKAAFDRAVEASQKELEDFDKPGNAAREEKYNKREAAQEKDSAIGRALNMMRFGFGIAGSREGTLAGALNKEGREGITALIQGEAANRAAKDKLDDARDNFEQQKVAAKKGNYQAAQTAGREASRDLQTATQLGITGNHYTDTAKLNLYQTQQQGNYHQAALNNQGVLGLADLGLKRDQLRQNAASANAQLQLGREKLNIIKGQIAAGDKRATAALANVEQKAYAAFQASSDYRIAQEKAKKMPPIEAQRYMQQEWTKYSANAMPSLLAAEGGGGVSVPSFADLMKAEE